MESHSSCPLLHDVRKASIDALKGMAHWCRSRIIDVMSKNGGHLASNLGSVEFSLAMHHVFDSPNDRFLFDVSHQTYTHKILTGRDDRFETIRQYKGISGFAAPDESVHDHFFAGHAGTALSAGLGCAKARDLAKSDEFILPVVSDASLTCGLTFEALNNIDPHLKRFIVILNDNDMAIAENVGAITRILRQNPALFFEQFGLYYMGPVNGHDIEATIKALKSARAIERPVLLHLQTVKGYGMESAVESPTIYHGVKPFDIATGKFLPAKVKGPTFPKIFGKKMVELAERWKELVVITPAMPAGSCLTQMMELFPERCIDVGIAEGHSITFAGALAKYHERKVVVSIYSTFLQRALDNLFHDVCLQNTPVVFCLDRSGVAGGDGVTHNGVYDIGFLNSMPGIVVCQPRNGHVLKELIDSSFTYEAPVVIRYPNLPTEEPEAPLLYRPLGKAELLQTGAEIAILALGHTIKTAFEVSHLLEQQGVMPTILDPIFIKPLDTELLSQVISTHQMLVVIEENSIKSGLCAIIHSFLMESSLPYLKVFSFAVPDRFVEHGAHSSLTRELGLNSESIANAILKERLEAVL